MERHALRACAGMALRPALCAAPLADKLREIKWPQRAGSGCAVVAPWRRRRVRYRERVKEAPRQCPAWGSGVGTGCP